MNHALELAPDLSAPAELELDPEQRITLCETLDRVLNKGVVVAGEVIISVAGVDLIYLNLQVLLASVETAYRHRMAPEQPRYGGVA